MKKTLKRLSAVVLVALLAVASLLSTACTNTTPKPPKKPTTVTVIDGGESDYVIVYPDGDTVQRARAAELKTKIKKLTGAELTIVSDAEDAAAHEIAVGETNRDVSAKLQTELDKKPSEDNNYGILVDNECVAVGANTDLGWKKFLTYAESYIVDGSMTLDSDLCDLQAYTKAQEDADKKAEEDRKNQEEQERLQEQIDALIEEINGFTYNTSHGLAGKQVTKELGGTWGKPEKYPTKGQHPRILVTEDDLPRIRDAVKNGSINSGVLSEFMTRAKTTVTGKLGAKYEHTDWPGCYNWDGDMLTTLQAKAFYYLLTGEELYGYQAIMGMFNYLDTLDIGYFNADQWRRYGYTMYTAACIYDWCYDLMDAGTRNYMTLGVENLCCSGTSSMPDKATWAGRKMEMGFPPTSAEGYVVGHPSELQMLSFYNSYALAIYDEVPGWYEMIGGRIFDEYIPIRRQIHATGMFPQGSAEYAQMRYMGDMYCAWLYTAALGENPFNADDMASVARSLIAHEAGSNGFMFLTGDGNSTTHRTEVAYDALMGSYLSGDTVLRSYVEENMVLMRSRTPKSWHTFMSVADVLICLSRDVQTKTNWRDDIGTIVYNSGYYQQVISRDAWDESGVTVLLHGGGRSSYGHDHASNGNFQIYYKGLLTGDAGVYDSWGTMHMLHYHQATIGHNGILVYNPSLASSCDSWYSGGQKETGTNLHPIEKDWLTTDTEPVRGTATGIQYGWYDAAKKRTKYVYFASDLTKAYDSKTVSYIGRSFLTAYTEDDTFPMVLFVFDRVDATNASFRKSFLLQCAKKPTVSGNTITVDNGSGKLVLTSLTGGTITTYGDGGNKPRYYIEGKGTVNTPKSAAADLMWGRAEISPATGNKSDLMLNVIYVTDSGTTKKITPTLLKTDDFIGANALNHTAYFYSGNAYCQKTVTLKAAGTGSVTYYVGGLAGGKWTVTAGGQTISTVTVTNEGHMATFVYNGTGDITLTPAK